MIPEIKIIDTSYFSDMLVYYPLTEQRFSFVWGKLEEKIKSKEIILLDVVYKELKEIDKKEVNNFLQKFENDLQYTELQDYIKIASSYEKNKQKFNGNFENNFGTTKKEINADPYLIAKAIKMKNAIILTDEKPSQVSVNQPIKLNIPNFANLFGIRCFELKDNINKIID